MQTLRICNIEEALTRYLITGKGKVASIYEYTANILYRDEIAKMRSKVCPFCGRKFKSRGALYAHLNRSSSRLSMNKHVLRGRTHSLYTNECYVLFQQMLEDIVETANIARRYIIKNNGKYVVTNVYPHPKFDSKYEAVKYVVMNSGL